MSKKNFDKFINSKSNSSKKEEFRQAKRSIKTEIAEGMAKTKARKAADTATRKNTGPTGKAGRKAIENQSTKGVPALEAPIIPRKAPKPPKEGDSPLSQMPLNKYIAHGGISSRREAAVLVKEGVVTVNGKLVTEPGYKVGETDEVRVNDKKIVPSVNLVYVLLNKPKDVITTSNDPEGRKTVMDLVRKATTERIFPIGRLDRNTTGVLLLTNDGELSQKLAHPAFQVKKIYEIRLDKDLTKKDFDTIISGVELEDGIISPDALAYADAKDKSVIGIEIHSGKNRIVRRIFEHLGYQVKNLDRVLYAGLTKKNVDRGRWRFLNEKEVRILKYLNASYKPTVKDVKIKAEKQALRDEQSEASEDWDLRPKEEKPASARVRHKKPSGTGARRTKPGDATSHEAKSRHAKPKGSPSHDARPRHGKSARVPSNDAKPSQAKPAGARPSQEKPLDAHHPKAIQPKRTGAMPASKKPKAK